MSVNVYAEVTGLKAASLALAKKMELIQKKKDLALNQVGRVIESSVKGKAPVRTGALRDSIQYFREKDGVIIGVPKGSRAGKYAGFVNEKHKTKGKYLENGVITQYSEIVKLMEEIVK